MDKQTEWKEELRVIWNKDNGAIAFGELLSKVGYIRAEAISAELQRILERVTEMYYKPEAPEELTIDSHEQWFNQALDAVKSIIKDDITKKVIKETHKQYKNTFKMLGEE
jgi:acyl CoA:acetate/3-ketoacid CoA transferase